MTSIDRKDDRLMDDREREKLMEIRLWSPEKTIDQLRQRIFQYTRTISHMNNNLDPRNQNPVPPSWDDIAVFQSSIVKQLEDIHLILREQAAFLNAAHVSPTGNFPYDSEGVVQFLLRKRLDPVVDKWRTKTRKEGEALAHSAAAAGPYSMETDEQVNWQELWQWAGEQTQLILPEVFSIADMEESRAEASSDSGMSGDAAGDSGAKTAKTTPAARKGPSLEDILRFQSTGRPLGGT